MHRRCCCERLEVERIGRQDHVAVYREQPPTGCTSSGATGSHGSRTGYFLAALPKVDRRVLRSVASFGSGTSDRAFARPRPAGNSLFFTLTGVVSPRPDLSMSSIKPRARPRDAADSRGCTRRPGSTLSMPGTRRVVVVEAAARGARAERDHPLGIGHLLVDALERRRLALAHRADHPEQIGLTRREARGLGAEARDVVARARRARTPCRSTPSRTGTGTASTCAPSRAARRPRREGTTGPGTQIRSSATRDLPLVRNDGPRLAADKPS